MRNLRRVSMKKIREILRLQAGNLGLRQIARSLNISLGAVHKYLKLAKDTNLSWPLPEDIDDKILAEKLYGTKDKCDSFVSPDFEVIHKELMHKGVTLQLLHNEYKINYPQTHYSYRRFCEMYRSWQKNKKITLRQDYKGGDKMLVDYAGQTIPVTNKLTGEITNAQIFVAVLGASNYTYSEASLDQKLESWLNSHIRAFNYFKGVPALIVPDNLKSGINKACRYEPDVNQNYAEMISYYDSAVLPARPYKPQDKAKAENAVLVVERWILASLRHKIFYSITELNQTIHALLEDFNNRNLQKINATRKSLYEEIDLPALKPLPQKPFEYARYYHRKIQADYHIEIDNHFYSVPYTYIGKQVDLRVTQGIIEVLCDGKRIASHLRIKERGKTTTSGHMPKSHQKYLQWTKDETLKWAKDIGPSTLEVAMNIIATKAHIDQATRICLGLSRLSRHFTGGRLEAACKRALHYNIVSYKHIARILQNNLDRESLDTDTNNNASFEHSNIRGSRYYSEESC